MLYFSDHVSFQNISTSNIITARANNVFTNFLMGVVNVMRYRSCNHMQKDPHYQQLSAFNLSRFKQGMESKTIIPSPLMSLSIKKLCQLCLSAFQWVLRFLCGHNNTHQPSSVPGLHNPQLQHIRVNFPNYSICDVYQITCSPTEIP